MAIGQAAGQTQDKSSISGTVTDQTGAVVAGAKVELTRAGGFTQQSQANEKGVYSFGGLEAGVYTLKVTAPEFAPQTLSNISLEAGQELTLDATLAPQAANTEVEVKEKGVGDVELENATVSGTITQKEVVKIGLNGRNFSQLIQLAPGVSNQTNQDEARVGVVGSVKYSVNGGRVEYNTFEVDGSDVLNTGVNGASSTLVVYPSLDAIQEVKVLTSNYGAQYGRTASGTVEVITKSGTPSLHGNLYDFARNEAFNAKNYFDPGSAAPLYRRQDFGGSIGGPFTIPHVYNTRKDKTFFFFSEEFRLEKDPQYGTYNQAVPSLKERGLIMTPQGVKPNLVKDPLTGIAYQDFDFTDVCPLQGQTFTRQQFPDCPSAGPSGVPGVLLPIEHLNQPVGLGQTTPSNYGVDKNALALLDSNLIPLPNSPTGCNYRVANLDPTDPDHCYDAVISPPTYWREELFKIDHNLTNATKVQFRYIHDAWDTTTLVPQWSILRTTNPGAATFPGIENRFVGPGVSLVARVTQTISPTFVNDLVLSYANSTITLADRNGSNNAVFQRNPTIDQPLVSDPSSPGQCNPAISIDPATYIPQCAMGHIFSNGFGGKMPGVEILGSNAAYGGRGFAADPGYMPWSHTNPTYSVRDDIGKTLGKHTLQFGGQAVYFERNQTNNAIGAASGELQGFLTFNNLARSTGNAFADFLLRYQGSSGCQGVWCSNIQSFTQDSTQHRYYQRYQVGEPYFQDDWKVTNRLTLNLGLRVSLFGTYSEKNNSVWNWEATRFNKTRFAVDPTYGVLLDKTSGGTIVTFNQSTFQLDPGVISDLGLVQCGRGGVPSSCMKGHLFNPAPRAGFAWDPKGDGKTSIRGGYGIFFEHGTGNEANTGSLEASSPMVLSMTQPLPHSYPCIGFVGYGPSIDPSNSACVNLQGSPPAAGSVFPLNVTAIPTKAVWPYAQQWSFGVQREMPWNFLTTISYVGSKGTHLTLERNLNQLPPLPANENPFGPNEPLTIADCTSLPPNSPAGTNPGDAAGTPFYLQSGVIVTPQSPAYLHLQTACANPNIPNINSLPHPYQGLGQVLSLENIADSSYHALQVTLRRTAGPLTAGLAYSYSHSLDNSSDRSDPVLVNSYDVRGNWASSNFDERHLVSISYIYDLARLPLWLEQLGSGQSGEPVGDGQASQTLGSPSQLLQRIAGGWELEGLTLFQSGTPFTVINSAGNTGVSVTDNAGVASGFGTAASYPDVVHGLSYTLHNLNSVGPLLGNPAQFVAPRGLTFGDAGRNFLNNPGRLNFDMSLFRHFKLGERGEVEFRAEVFNVFNHTEFRIYDPENPSATGNNVVSCYAGPLYSAGFIASGGADCITGASFLHPLNAHRPRTVQFGLKMAF